MILYLHENALTDFFLISLTSCLDCPTRFRENQRQRYPNRSACVTIAMVTAVAWKAAKTSKLIIG